MSKIFNKISFALNYKKQKKNIRSLETLANTKQSRYKIKKKNRFSSIETHRFCIKSKSEENKFYYFHL